MNYKKARAESKYISGLNSPFKLINVMSSSSGYVNSPKHSHSFYHLNYIFSGSLTVTFKEKVYNITGGMAFILPPNIPHSIYTEEGYCQLGIDIFNSPDDRHLLELLQSVCQNECRVCKIKEPSTSFDEMQRIICNPTALNHHLAEHKAEEILLNTVVALNKTKKSSFEIKFEQALRDLGDTPALEDVCKHTGYSRVHIERLAKKQFGCGVIEYTNKLKINRICSLLMNTDMPISQIAETEGFYDSGHLTVFFKKRMGVTPSKYRK